MKKNKFFVKENDELFVVYDEFFDAIKSREEALSIAIEILNEMRSVLCKDIEQTSYIGNMKVTTGLQKSLDELNKRYPCLVHEIYAVRRKFNGQRVFAC